jgi:serine/threonine-protein kinase
MSDVFISYKAEDRRRVHKFVDALQADGFTVWWDAQLAGGAAWRRSIEEQLDAARCVIVIWSTTSVGPAGAFVHDEASRAMERQVYLPVKIDKVRPPLGFGERQALDLTGWRGNRTDARYRELLDAIRKMLCEAAPATAISSDRLPSRRMVLAGGALALTTGAAGWILWKPKPQKAQSIAVLPFANLSGDPRQSYFADGIAEELRSALARIGMQVIGRASSDAVKDLDTRTAASKLGVANVLSGSVRRSTDIIRVGAQLVSGKNGLEIWAQNYDRAPGDVIKIQSDIAQNVARALSLVLGQASASALEAGGTANPVAQDLLLQARGDRDSDNLAGLERRLALISAALALDPHYAEAYAEKALLLRYKAAAFERSAEAGRRGLTEALSVVNRGLAIAPKMSIGYSVRGSIYGAQLQLGLALANLRHAVSLPGGDQAEVLAVYAFLLSLIGHAQEALSLFDRTVALDPLNPARFTSETFIRFNARQYAASLASARRALEIAPHSVNIRDVVGRILLIEGKPAEALAEYRKLDPADARRIFGETLIAARTGQRSLALKQLQEMQERYGDTAHYQYAQVHSIFGDRDAAFEELGKALAVRDAGLAAVRVQPFFDPIRGDPRFANLESKLGLPPN